MMTMPPTTREMEAMPMVTTKKVPLIFFQSARKESLVSTAKSSLAL